MGEVVHVWWATIDDLTAADAELLDDAERAGRTRLQRANDRDRFVLGAALVRCLVAHLDGTDPDQVASTGPAPGAESSTAPSPPPADRGSAACRTPASTPSPRRPSPPVGVDVETACPPEWRDLLPDVLAPGEAGPADEDAFLALWVRKEAVLKATREGLTRPMSSVDLAGLRELAVHDLDVPGAAAAPRRRRPQAGTGTRRRTMPAGAAARLSRQSAHPGGSTSVHSRADASRRANRPTTSW